MRIESKAPTRVDLAGGTLDIWPLYLFHPGAVTVNAAITRYASCVIERTRRATSASIWFRATQHVKRALLRSRRW
jgi:D-glycero-alpha-D-manno-heptose-7-phosphate kinase